MRPVTERRGDEMMLLEQDFPERLMDLRRRRRPGPCDRAIDSVPMERKGCRVLAEGEKVHRGKHRK